MQGVTMPGQSITSMIVELCRDEVKLQIGTPVRRSGRAQEAAGLSNIRCARPVAHQPITQALKSFSQGTEIIGVITAALLQHAVVEMVLKIRADASGGDTHWNTESFEFTSRTNP